MLTLLARAAAAGALATIAMDLWNAFLLKAFKIPSLNLCFLGRWARHLEHGVARHVRIGASPAKPFECPVGWAVHYSIGVGLALGFALLVPRTWFVQPSLVPAISYGIATVVFPLFVLQPALGLGLASAATPHPWRARLKSLATHTVYGTGLYFSALLLSRLG